MGWHPNFNMESFMKRKTLSSFIPPLYNDTKTGQKEVTGIYHCGRTGQIVTSENKEQATMETPIEQVTVKIAEPTNAQRKGDET